MAPHLSDAHVDRARDALERSHQHGREKVAARMLGCESLLGGKVAGQARPTLAGARQDAIPTGDVCRIGAIRHAASYLGWLEEGDRGWTGHAGRMAMQKATDA